ncbi:MAG: ATP synthase F1 subunit delta [Candidatus Limnocylindrales bacterium]|jgi:F-type H+-transporting ATPase subunit delta
MLHSAAARRYAQALFELATRDDRVDAWRADIGLACGLAQDELAVRSIDSPAVPFRERRRVVEQILRARVSGRVLNLALLLAERGRFSILPAVSDEYDDLVRQSRGIVGVTVTSPSPLSEREIEMLKGRIEKLAGARVEIATEINPALIGGLCVMIGDLQIDASVANRLARLRWQLVQGMS